MKLSEQVWNETRCIYNAILQHPFNQELMCGTLPKETFSYYIEQDTLYLRDFARALSLIAARSDHTPTIKSFLKFAHNALFAEQDLVHNYYKETTHIYPVKPTVATLAYTSYVLNICSLESIEIAVAAVLPCFWIYREVGVYMKSAVEDNPYARWIETYSGAEFSADVSEIIDIFDGLAKDATAIIRQKMSEAFYKSSVLEWLFWHDAYTKHIFDDVMLEMSLSTLCLPLSVGSTT